MGFRQPRGATGSPERLALIEYLRDRGASVERIINAATTGDLQGLGFDLLMEQGEYTLDQLAAEVAMTSDDLCLLYRHLGVELTDLDVAMFDREEAEFIQKLREIISVFPPEASD